MSFGREAGAEQRISTRGIATGISWLAANKLVTMLLSFGSMMVLARLLTPADFGIMAAAMLVVALASAIFEGAFGINLVRRAEIDDRSVATTFWLSALVGLITFLIVAVFSPAVESFFDFRDLTWIVLVAASSILFKAIGSVSQSLLQRRGQFRLLATTNSLSYMIGNTVCSIILALQGFGVWSLVIGSTITAILESFANLVFARIPLLVAPSRAAASEVFRLSGWFAVSQVLNWAATAGANAVTGRFLGAEALGIYSRGWKLIDILVSATAQPMQRVLLPSFARKQRDLEDLNGAFIKALDVAAFAFTALSGFAVIHAQPLVLLVLGPQWTATVPVVQLLFAALLPRCCYKISEALAYACGSSFGATMRQAMYAAMVIGGAIFASRWGPAAVAAAVSIALWAFYLISIGYVVSITRVSITSLFATHLRAILLTAPALIVDFGVLMLAPVSFWPAHFVAGLSGMFIMALTLVAAPGLFLGKALSGSRATGAVRLKQALSGRLRRAP